MSALPPFRQIQFNQIPGAPPWFAGFISSFNVFIGSVYDALNNGTTFGDNIPSQIKSLTVSVDASGNFAPQSFACTLPKAPQACFLAQVTLNTGVVSPVAISLNQWSYVSGKVQLDSIVGMQPASTYQLTFFTI